MLGLLHKQKADFLQRLWIFAVISFCLGCTDRKLDVTYLTSIFNGVLVELSSSEPLHTNQSPITVRVSFSESIQDFSLANIEIEGGNLSTSTPLLGSGRVFDIEIEASMDEGDLKIHFPAQELSFVSDVDGSIVLKTTKSVRLQRRIDRIPPVIEERELVNLIGNSTTIFAWRFTVSGAETLNLRSDLILLQGDSVGCSVQLRDVASTGFAVEVHGCTGNGTFNIVLPEGVAKDLAGNLSAPLVTSHLAAVDNTPPTLVIGSPTPGLGNVNAIFTWLVTYTDAQQILLAPEHLILVGSATQGCSLVVREVSSNERLVEATGCTSDGPLSLQIRAGSAKDGAGNLAIAQTSSSSTTVDNTAPTLTLTNVGPDIGDLGTVFEWRADYVGADSISLGVADIELSGEVAGCVPQVSGTGDSQRVIQVTGCTGVTNFKISVKAGSAQDNAGNLAGGVTSANIILNNPVSVRFETITSVLNKSANDETQSVFVELSRALPKPVRVDFVIQAATTANNPVDYSLISTPHIIIPANVTRGELSYLYKGTSIGSKIIQLGLQDASSETVTFNMSSLPHRRLVKDANQHDASYKSVDLGGNHSCGIATDDSLKCWGDNFNGELGTGTTVGSQKPVAVNLPGGVKQVSLGSKHTCAVLLNGDLYCWGSGVFGQLGLGSTATSLTPAKVGSGYLSVSAGGDFTCAIKNISDLFCWGKNSSGQLGLGTTTTVAMPSMVIGGVHSVSSGDAHACAVKSTGDLYCWGSGGAGQLGIGSLVGQTVPQSVGSNYQKVSAGADYTCAITSTSILHCWGRGENGQLGNGGWTNTTAPQPVTGSYSHVSTGVNHVCGITNGDGVLKCWGGNTLGQLGDGSIVDVNLPKEIGTNVMEVASGGYHTCAVKSDKTVFCWGSNTQGQAGEYAIPKTPSPLVPAVGP